MAKKYFNQVLSTFEAVQCMRFVDVYLGQASGESKDIIVPKGK